MRNTRYEVQDVEDCFICGNGMTLFTSAEQPEPRQGVVAWEAFDGDDVICLECGAVAWASVDEGDAWINYDETEPHNVEREKQWEAREQIRES